MGSALGSGWKAGMKRRSFFRNEGGSAFETVCKEVKRAGPGIRVQIGAHLLLSVGSQAHYLILASLQE